MSTKIAAVVSNRGRLPLRELAMGVLLVSVFLQGLGGALTTGSDPLASATLILLVGTPFLFVYSLAKYRSSMFTMGTYGVSKTRILGFDVDTVALRWAFVVLTGATSVGINLGIPGADGTIGTGPRLAIQACGTLFAGVTVFVARREYMQLVMRGLLLGGVAFAVGVFAGGGKLDTGGLVWAAVCALHMFTLTKALTVFGTQKNRDGGMTLANVLALGVMLVWAGLHDGMPGPDKFEGALLPVGVLYVAIPAAIMIIPVLGMNWARNHLEEADQAMLTSTAPIWGAIAAFGLALFGWAVPPSLDLAQWVGIVMVVLAALGAALDVANRERWETRLKAMHADLDPAGIERERPQAELSTGDAEAQPPADLGNGTINSASGLVVALESLSFGEATGLTIRRDGYAVTAANVRGGVIHADGCFTGDRLTDGTIRTGGLETRFRQGEAVVADPARLVIGKVNGINLGGEPAAE